MTMEELRSLYGNMLDSLKMEQPKEKITNLNGTSIMSILNLSFSIFAFS